MPAGISIWPSFPPLSAEWLRSCDTSGNTGNMYLRVGVVNNFSIHPELLRSTHFRVHLW